MLEHIANAWEAVEPYLYQLLIGIVAVLALLKDWNDYGSLSKRFGKRLPLFLAIITGLITLLSLAETHNSQAGARQQREAAEKRDTISQTQISDLTEQVRQGRAENQQNSAGFRRSFSALYDKYSDLAARVKNEDLLKEVKKTREELVATQQKLTPPTATLVASFYSLDTSQLPMREVTAHKSGDSVSVDLIIMNNTGTTALNGEWLVRICTLCKYAKEPEGFIQRKGASDFDRSMGFQHVLAHSLVEKHTVQIIPPLLENRFELDCLFKCENCINEDEFQHLWVNVQ